MLPLVFLLLATAASPADAQVYRCGNEYTHTPCSNGVQVDTSPAMADPAGPSTVVINLCRARGGQTYWIDGQCSARGWTLLRTARVPANASWEEQLEDARAQHRAARVATAPPPVVYNTGPAQPSGKDECARLDARVAQLDSMGRAGSRHYDLEWVRRERKDARDQQFRLRC